MQYDVQKASAWTLTSLCLLLDAKTTISIMPGGWSYLVLDSFVT